MTPWVWHPHPVGWAAVAAVVLAYVLVCRHVAKADVPGATPTARQWWLLAASMVALLAAVTWPLADLAAHWSLTALLVQRMLLVLAVAPLLLLATPAPVLAWLTAPAPVDDALALVTRPPVAVLVFTAVMVGTLLSPAVAAQASSGWVRAVTTVALVLAGCILWGPVLRHVPGASRPVAIGVAGYLFVQSVVPGFPALVFIFARHPLYPAFAGAPHAIGLSPLTDQQVAGVLTKVATLPVLWTVAWIMLARAQRADTLGVDPDPLLWVDVERRLHRAERREHRHKRRHRPERVRYRAFPPLPNVAGPDDGTGSDGDNRREPPRRPPPQADSPDERGP
jgi:cytochrome c oxidase assembly factor CtaG